MIIALSIGLITVSIVWAVEYKKLSDQHKDFIVEATEREIVHGKTLDQYLVTLDRLRARQETTTNPVLTGVLNKFYGQTEKGLQKYGNTVNPDEYTEEEWLLHFQQEMIDGAVYVETLIQKRSGE